MKIKDNLKICFVGFTNKQCCPLDYNWASCRFDLSNLLPLSLLSLSLLFISYGLKYFCYCCVQSIWTSSGEQLWQASLPNNNKQKSMPCSSHCWPACVCMCVVCVCMYACVPVCACQESLRTNSIWPDRLHCVASSLLFLSLTWPQYNYKNPTGILLSAGFIKVP